MDLAPGRKMLRIQERYYILIYLMIYYVLVSIFLNRPGKLKNVQVDHGAIGPRVLLLVVMATK